MKKKVVCISIFIISVIICLSGLIYMNEIEKDRRVVTAISKAVVNNIELEGNVFNEDENITAKTYLLSEKDIKIPVLLYHEFYEEEPSKDLWGLISTPEKFEKDMLCILEEGYTFVSLDRVIDYKNGLKGLPEKCVVLTFDDGYTSNYTLIYPILKKYNIPATIFVVGDMMDAPHHFDWDIAKEMNDKGLVKIYTHGHSHIDMTKLDIEEFREKTANNFKLLEEKLGKQEHIVFSYPLGFYNDETNKVLDELGVEMAMTTNLGLNDSETLKTGLLNRDYITYNYSERTILSIIKGR